MRPYGEQSVKVPVTNQNSDNIGMKEQTEGGDYDYLGPLRNQFAERFWEGKIPADKHTDRAEWCLDDFVWVFSAGRQMGTLRMPSQDPCQQVRDDWRCGSGINAVAVPYQRFFFW